MDAKTLTPQSAIDLAREPALAIGSLRILPASLEIASGDLREHLQAQPMKVLVALARRAGEVVSREQIVDQCWDGRIVGEDVINRAVLLLRGVADRLGGFQIETIRKAGYRLTAEPQRARPVSRRRLALVLTAFVAAASIFMLRPSSWPTTSIPVTIEIAPLTTTGGRMASDIARSTNTVVADMLADSGIAVLRPAEQAADKPTADLRLSGQVRSADGRLEATLQLDDLSHGTLLLSRRFVSTQADGQDLPGRVGAFFATSLATSGALMILDRSNPGDPRLTGEILRYLSMLFAHEDTLRTYQAVERIAAQMPDSAIAQLGLALSTPHALPMMSAEARPVALAKARLAADRAHRLAPTFGDTYWPDCALYSPARFDQCETAARRGVAVDPDSPFAAANLRNLLTSVGRFREALIYDRMAVAAMPYMGARLANSAMLLEGLGQSREAERRFQESVRWWPDYHIAYAQRIEGMLDRGDLAAAARFAATIPEAVGTVNRQGIRRLREHVAANRSDLIRAECLARALDKTLLYPCVLALTQVHDRKGALDLLDIMFPALIAPSREDEDRRFLAQVGDLNLRILSAPALAPLRSDPRFLAIAGRVGLMDYWRRHRPDFCTDGGQSVCRTFAGSTRRID